MPSENKLTASQEDYLEAIYNIVADKMAARAKDIAEYLAVRASSVTGALRTLSAMGLVNYAPYDLITLTEKGHTAAEEIVRRHKALENFLVNVLGVDAREADEAACKMEHSVPKAIVERLVKYAEYVDKCPKGGISWESGFGYYCKHGCTEEDCKKCHCKEA
ncbi:MAG: metal-dependent transcriptional regulator [Candidatus Electrothrix aestuarii]|uniref:Transcriptional regulator MntR n=1 Tax=Candidatus Electrothrix aestuarii TaxID=3062594 RepID=A0AAU8LZT0_9BACT|nr:metal-dependent transcriptional regulator [Candidatus Electrothrix aestuarii]WPD23710.1 MAG: metal-dependent transcriptional regulator [Candidatus Electrothrix sp. GW3-3]